MRIASVARAFPPHCYSQAEIRARLTEAWGHRPSAVRRLESLHEHTLVKQRHLAMRTEEYLGERTFGQNNDTWIRVAQELGEVAVGDALKQAGLEVQDVDAVFSVSVTGLASPSLEARLANRMGFRSDVKRTPIFGLGCVAGAAGIARAADYVKAYPDQVAVLLSVELCSLTFQMEDTSIANLISTGLFGDGAAAVVVVGEQRARSMGLGGLRVLDTRSVFYRDTEDLMGWTISEKGFEIVLSPAVPSVAQEQLGVDVDVFLADHDMQRADVASWICHPGGPKVLQGMATGLGLSDDQVKHAWKALAEQGNLSSASVLMVLHEFLTEGSPGEGQRGLLLAMGPGFCSELVLFEWCR